MINAYLKITKNIDTQRLFFFITYNIISKEAGTYVTLHGND